MTTTILPQKLPTSQGRIALRPYQEDAVAAILAAGQRGLQRVMAQLPTGCGKTVIGDTVIDRRAHLGRALVIAHRHELLVGAAETARRISPHLSQGWIKAERDDHADADIVFASAQTLAGEHRRAPLKGTLATIFVDEAHHAVAPSWRSSLQDLGAWDEGGPLTFGMTATAGQRSDKVAHGNVFEGLVYQMSPLMAIAKGYLCDIDALEIRSDLDLTKVTTSGGDFTNGSLGTELEESGALLAAAHGYAQHAADLKGVAFTPTVAAAKRLAEYLTDLGIPAEALSGKTPAVERAAILARLKAGTTQVVCNAAVLTEGWDEPSIACCLLVRPTKSQTLFTQMVGRVLRLHPGKERARLLTLFTPPAAGVTVIGDLAGDGDPDAPKVTVRRGETLGEAAERTKEQIRIKQMTPPKISTRELDLFQTSRAAWIKVETGLVLPATTNRMVYLVPRPGGRWDVVDHQHGRRPSCDITGVSADMGRRVAEEVAQVAANGALTERTAPHRRLPPTADQVNELRRYGRPIPTTRGAAEDMVARERARPTMLALLAGRIA